ncbi:MAG: hypothetical protein JSR97_07795 [Verrucomicrobia bacterium]|nr:hypothetical protein [Verrucomicrobiota bacterium]
MQGSYNNFSYFSASHAKLENIVANLSSPEFAVKSHGDIEEFIQQEGT